MVTLPSYSMYVLYGEIPELKKIVLKIINLHKISGTVKLSDVWCLPSW